MLDDGLKEFDSHLNFYVPIEELRADEEAWKRLVEEWLSPEAEAERQAVPRDGRSPPSTPSSARHEGERVAVVCHGGVINAYLSDIISLPGTMWFEPAYTSVSRAMAGGSHKQLVSLNETPHLPHLVLPGHDGLIRPASSGWPAARAIRSARASSPARVDPAPAAPRARATASATRPTATWASASSTWARGAVPTPGMSQRSSSARSSAVGSPSER